MINPINSTAKGNKKGKNKPKITSGLNFMDSLTVTNYGTLRNVIKDFGKKRHDKMEKVVSILALGLLFIILYVIF
jgi:hypothetical protein